MTTNSVLGNVPGITGLNIADNPIEFPPKTVIQEGTQSILKFLRLELQSESLLIPGTKPSNYFIFGCI